MDKTKKYYKVLPENLKCRGFQYHEGLNIDTNLINNEECSNGLHFAEVKNIFKFCDHGIMLAEVEVPDDAVVYEFRNKYKADKIILKNIRPLWAVEGIQLLVEQGANIHANDDYALCLAARNGHLDVVKYFVEQGADICAWGDTALDWADETGHPEIVEYLKSL